MTALSFTFLSFYYLIRWLLNALSSSLFRNLISLSLPPPKSSSLPTGVTVCPHYNHIIYPTFQFLISPFFSLVLSYYLRFILLLLIPLSFPSIIIMLHTSFFFSLRTICIRLLHWILFSPSIIIRSSALCPYSTIHNCVICYNIHFYHRNSHSTAIRYSTGQIIRFSQAIF